MKGFIMKFKDKIVDNNDESFKSCNLVPFTFTNTKQLKTNDKYNQIFKVLSSFFTLSLGLRKEMNNNFDNSINEILNNYNNLEIDDFVNKIRDKSLEENTDILAFTYKLVSNICYEQVYKLKHFTIVRENDELTYANAKNHTFIFKTEDFNYSKFKDLLSHIFCDKSENHISYLLKDKKDNEYVLLMFEPSYY